MSDQTFKPRFNFLEETAHLSLRATHADRSSLEPPVASFLEETDIFLLYEQAFITALWLRWQISNKIDQRYLLQ